MEIINTCLATIAVLLCIPPSTLSSRIGFLRYCQTHTAITHGGLRVYILLDNNNNKNMKKRINKFYFNIIKRRKLFKM